MLSQNRLRWMAMKHDFFGSSNKFQRTLKFSSFSRESSPVTSSYLENTINIYQKSALKNTRTLVKHTLPKMPVPQLNASVSKFLTAVKPLLNETEFNDTERSASEFVKKGGVGEKLQSILVERAERTENWLSEWWLDKVYLEPRYSLVIGCNPATLYPKANYETVDQQLEFATKYIMGFLEFRKYVENLPADKMGKDDLCMDQHHKIFGSCRIPNQLKDDFKIFKANEIDIGKTNHVTIMYNNRIFQLQILDPITGESLKKERIFENLKNLIESATEKGLGLGVLTSGHRDNWYEVYSELAKNESNKKNFESIQNSFFVLCLDGDEHSINNDMDTRSIACGQMLHGNKEYTPNRWFDKAVQVIVGRNGVFGTNFEHSVAEAGPHILMHDFIYKSVLENKEKLEILEPNESKPMPQELSFIISAAIQENIMATSLLTNKLIENLELFVLSFDYFGKNFPKSQKLSPDAFVQIAMQLAFYRTHEFLGNSYESGSLRRFHLGRTDVIRTCSSDTAEFVRAMLTDISHVNKAELLKKAIQAHSQYTKGVLNCESFDRHFFGLKQIALENEIELPDFYNAIGYRKINHFYISSSQISSKFDSVTSYGPLVEDGYGCSYNIMETKLMFGISANNSCQNTSAKLYAANLKQSLLDCQGLLTKVNAKL